jgi:hypothetical protein
LLANSVHVTHLPAPWPTLVSYGLVQHLQEPHARGLAETLASIGKTSDAVKKLSDFTVKVDQLEAAGRISAESANLLRSDAQVTIDCLQGSDASTAEGS